MYPFPYNAPFRQVRLIISINQAESASIRIGILPNGPGNQKTDWMSRCSNNTCSTGTVLRSEIVITRRSPTADFFLSGNRGIKNTLVKSNVNRTIIKKNASINDYY